MLYTLIAHAIESASQLQIPLPNPTPSAPPEVTAGVDKIMGLVKWGSLIAAVVGLLAFGFMSLAADSGGYGSQSADMKEKMGKILGAVVVVSSASSLVGFVYF